MSILDAKKNFIADIALEVFLEKSIAEVTIADIAKEAEAGEATIYRYFNNKKNLLVAAASRLSKRIYEEYCHYDLSLNGLNKLASFYFTYIDIFSKHKEYFRFIASFDAFMLSEETTLEGEYSNFLEEFKKFYDEAYLEGLKDNSVNTLADPELFYYTSTHSLLELSKKLSRLPIVKQDLEIKALEELKTLAELFISKLDKAGTFKGFNL